MHEASMTIQLIEYLLNEASKRNAKRIIEVYLDIGEFTNLNPNQINYLYNILSQKYSVLKDSKIYINNIQGIIKCVECGYEGSPGHDYEIIYIPLFSCPKCGEKVEIIRGQEFTVRRIKMIIK